MISITDNIYWKKTVTFFKFIGMELVIMLLLVFSINNYLNNPDDHIGLADGKGYYDYLPSIFIRNDINRKDFSHSEKPELYNVVTQEGHGFYVEYKDKYVNKYPVGTAILQLPFFLVEYWSSSTNKESLTGYEHSFQTSVFHAALFYLFLALFFLKLFLKELKVKIWIIFFIQLLIALGTNVTFYTNFDSSFSHVYSLFAINAFLYFSYCYFNAGKLKFFIWACVLFGLILDLRQINLLIVLILPFIAGSWSNLKEKIILLFKNPMYLLSGIGLITVIVFIQLYTWFLQTGDWFVYSYQNESFNFSEPHFIDILFSYKKGLFIYTPVAFIAVVSSLWLLVKKKYYLLGTWISFFIIITYILSSWWSWYYGCSFGHRAYVEFYGILFIPFALFLNEVKKWTCFAVLSLCLLAIPLNLIQSYQYSKYILHFIDMDKEKYWHIFLETEERFEGLVWIDELDLENIDVIGTKNLGDIHFKGKDMNVPFSFKLAELPFDFTNVSYVVFKVSGVIDRDMTSRVRVFINDMGKGEYYFLHEPYLIHFAQENFGTKQVGYYKYAFPKMEKVTDDKLDILFFANEKDFTLEEVELLFCK